MENDQKNLVMLGVPGISRSWETLFSHALLILDDIARHGRSKPFWTFGGGTVLMLRYGHRYSKDIDIFVPIRNHWALSRPGSVMSRNRSPPIMWRRRTTSNSI